MKLSLCNEVISNRPFEEQCTFAAALGYEGLEIAPFTLCDDPREMSETDVARARKSLDEAGIVATGLHWLLVTPAGLSITDPDDGLRGETLEVMLRTVDLCAELGGSVLVHGSPAQRSYGDGDDPEAARARAVEIFRRVAERAGERGVTYCLEALSEDETNFINRIEEAVSIVDEIGSPAFKTMIDTGAVARAEASSVAETIRKWMPGGNIAHIQFNDRNRRAAGQGDDDFRPVLQAIKDTGYDGVIAMEPFKYEPDRGACAAFALGYVKGIWESLP